MGMRQMVSFKLWIEKIRTLMFRNKESKMKYRVTTTNGRQTASWEFSKWADASQAKYNLTTAGWDCQIKKIKKSLEKI